MMAARAQSIHESNLQQWQEHLHTLETQLLDLLKSKRLVEADELRKDIDYGEEQVKSIKFILGRK
jgi:hypothetical protein